MKQIYDDHVNFYLSVHQSNFIIVIIPFGAARANNSITMYMLVWHLLLFSFMHNNYKPID